MQLLADSPNWAQGLRINNQITNRQLPLGKRDSLGGKQRPLLPVKIPNPTSLDCRAGIGMISKELP